MKVLFYYYSNMGNTRAACDYIMRNLPEVEWTLHDITLKEQFQSDHFDVIGFATWSHFLTSPELFHRFVKSLPRSENKPAFVFNTFGNFNAGTLAHLCHCISGRGYRIIAADALHMPDTRPVMICMNNANTDAPGQEEMLTFNRFISNIGTLLSGDPSTAPEVTLQPSRRFALRLPRWLGVWQMGPKFVDATACTRCGLCAAGCPYGAITMDDLPRFRESKCAACWRCYNRCPTQAIYTKKYRNRGHYPQPLPAVKEKLGIRAGTTQ